MLNLRHIMSDKQDWFQDWFNSPYYHLLYGNRDENEASNFIEALLQYLKPAEDAVFLDLACGKGRHARKINSLGFKTHGLDLSTESISHAKQYSSDNLFFQVGDMREVNYSIQFDYILNLFTSFGYFEDLHDNDVMLRSIHQQLKPGGQVLIDFLNFDKIRNSFPYKGEVLRGEIKFNIEKRVEDGRIYKDIRFHDQGIDFHFTEKVQAIDKAEMLQLLQTAGFDVQTIWGDYRLMPYTTDESDRLIVLAVKK